MNELIRRLIKSLTDTELRDLQACVYDEMSSRAKDPITEPVSYEEIRLISDDDRIGASKHYRSRTGCHLKDALDTIDASLAQTRPRL